MPAAVAEQEPLRTFRIIKEEGKPVGPHIDFDRDEDGVPIKDANGKLVERTYYPGDTIKVRADLNKLNGKGHGIAMKKFEEVYDGPRAETILPVAPREPKTKGLKVDEATLKRMPYPELVALITKEGIDLQGATKKEDIVKVVLATLGGGV